VRRKEQERAASFDEGFKDFGKSKAKCKKYMGDTFSTLLLLTPYLLYSLDTWPDKLLRVMLLQQKPIDLIH
jgi:hypothetical protein